MSRPELLGLGELRSRGCRRRPRSRSSSRPSSTTFPPGALDQARRLVAAQFGERAREHERLAVEGPAHDAALGGVELHSQPGPSAADRSAPCVRSSASSSTICSARIGPMPSAASISSAVAARSVVHRPEVLGERLGVDEADPRDAERVEHAAERLAPSSARSPRSGSRPRSRPNPSSSPDPLGRQVVDVAGVRDQALLEEALGVLLAQSLDLQRAAEVLDVLEDLAGAAGRGSGRS